MSFGNRQFGHVGSWCHLSGYLLVLERAGAANIRNLTTAL